MSKDTKLQHLSPEARTLWDDLGGDTLKPEGQVIAMTTCEALDRMRAAQQELRDAGKVSTTDKYGQIKAHPALAAEERARTAIVRGATTLARMRKADAAKSGKESYDAYWHGNLPGDQHRILKDAEEKLGVTLCPSETDFPYAIAHLDEEEGEIVRGVERQLGMRLTACNPL